MSFSSSSFLNSSSFSTSTSSSSASSSFSTSPLMLGDEKFSMSLSQNSFSTNNNTFAPPSYAFRSISFEQPLQKSITVESSPSLLNSGLAPLPLSHAQSFPHQFSSTSSSPFAKPSFSSFNASASLFSNQKVDTSSRNQITMMFNHVQVPQAPSYYEPHSSFLSDYAPEAILLKLVEVLQANPCVQMEVKDTKIKGHYFNNGDSCKWKISVFEKDNQRLVEFQRRQGDSFGFYAFYRETLMNLGEIVNPSDIPTGKGLAPPSEPQDVVLDTTSLNCLVGMALSSFYDVAREGASALVRLCSTAENQMVLGSDSRCAQLLSQLLSSKDMELVRCGAVLLSHLSKQTEVRSTIVNIAVSEISRHLSNPTQTMMLKEIQKQVLEAADSLSETHAHEFSQSSQFMKVAESYKDDPRLGPRLGQVLERIESH